MSSRRLLLWFWLAAIVVAGAACPGPKYPACDGDKDCKPPEKCVNKKCSQCRDNTDCKEGQQCGPAHTCIPTPGWCQTEADCAWSEVCKNHKCMACTSDAECGPSAHCRAGKCIRPGFCEKDEDCPEDEDCRNNRCVKLGQASTNIPKCPMDPVFFGFDVYTLSDEAKGILQKDFDCLQANKSRTVAVVGRTDPRGTVEYNIGLSDDRAQAVITYLSRLGVDPGRLLKVPKGAAEATGHDDATWAQDRRVEFVWR